jgi:hypothetical protein
MLKKSRNARGWIPGALVLCTAIMAAVSAIEVVPGDDLIQILNTSPDPLVQLTDPGGDTSSPLVYPLAESIVLDGERIISGDSRWLPHNVRLERTGAEGEVCPGNTVLDADFENGVNPDPDYWTESGKLPVRREDPNAARSPDVLAVFTGEETAARHIWQEAVFPYNYDGVDILQQTAAFPLVGPGPNQLTHIPVVLPVQSQGISRIQQDLPFPAIDTGTGNLEQDIFLPDLAAGNDRIEQAVTMPLLPQGIGILRQTGIKIPQKEPEIVTEITTTQLLSPIMTEITLWIRTEPGGAEDILEIGFDDDPPLLTVTGDDPAYHGVWVEESLDITAYAALNEEHTLYVRSTIRSINPAVFYLDDVCFTATPICFDFENAGAEWLSPGAISDIIVPFPEAHTGDHVARLGGAGPERPWLTFYLQRQGGASNQDTLDVFLDNTGIFDVNGAESSYAGGWKEVKIDLLDYADGAEYELRFESRTGSNANPAVFLVDDVCIHVEGGSPCPGTGIVRDESFEQGPYAYWEQLPPIDREIITAEAEARTFSHVARFGGLSPGEDLLLEFSLKIPAGGSSADLIEAGIDDTPLITITGDDPLFTDTWGRVTADASDFADGGEHTVYIRAMIEDPANPTTFYVDDVCLAPAGGANCPGDILVDPAFDSEEGWVQTSSDQVVIINTAEALSAPNAARFGGIVPGDLDLTFQLEIPGTGKAEDVFEVMIDGDVILSIPGDATAYQDTWAEARVSLLPWADDSVHTLAFAARINSENEPTEFRLDEVCAGTPCPGQAADGGFEDFPNDAWRQEGQIIVHESAVTPFGARFARFAGVPGAELLLQFWLRIGPERHRDDVFEVLVDETVLLTIPGNDVRYWDSYEMASVDIGQFADGGVHTLALQSRMISENAETVFYIDDICISGTELPPCPDNGVLPDGDFEQETGDAANSPWYEPPLYDDEDSEVIINVRKPPNEDVDAHTGDWVARFGGIPPGEMFMELWMKIPAADANEDDYFEVRIDDEEDALLTIQADDAAYQDTWTKAAIDLLNWADGGEHTFSFHSVINNETDPAFFHLDDVVITHSDLGSEDPPVLQDGGFETGWPDNPNWIQPEPVNQPVITGEGSGHDNSEWYARFGGAPSGVLSLRFALKINGTPGNPQDTFQVHVDAVSEDPVFAIFATNPQYQDTWTTVTADITEWADGQPHTLIFRSELDPDSLGTAFHLDDVCITHPLDADCTGNVIQAPGFREDATPYDHWEQIKPPAAEREIIDGANTSDALSAPGLAIFGGEEPAELALEFWLQIDDPNSDDYLAVWVDENEDDPLITISADAAGFDGGYAPVILNTKLSPWADGNPHTLHFRAVTANLGQPAAFHLDDICLNDGTVGTGCPGALLDYGAFEGNAEEIRLAWNIPPDSEILLTDNTQANNGTGSIFFQGSVNYSALTQTDITIPATALQLSFYLRIPQSSGNGIDRLNLLIDGTVAGTWRENAGGFSGWAPVTVKGNVFNTYADDAAHELTFEAWVEDTDVPAIFQIDDICIGTVIEGPVIIVEDGAAITLENLAITGGTLGILVMDGGRLDLNRCYIDNIAGDGLFLNNPDRVVITNSVVADCSGNAVYADGGRAHIFQSTFIDNRGAGLTAEGGTVNVAASLFHNSNPGIQGSSVRAYYNVFSESASFGQIEEIASVPSVQFDTSSWKGKLAEPIFTNVTIGTLPAELRAAAGEYDMTDFEAQPRADVLQVSADEVYADDDAVPQTNIWQYCLVDPAEIDFASETEAARLIAAGGEFSVTAILSQSVIGEAAMYLVPETGFFSQADLAAGGYLIPGNLDVTGNRIRGAFDLTTFAEDPNTGLDLCTNGRATVVIFTGGQWYGVNITGGGLMRDAAILDSQFIVDTVPPALVPANQQSVAAAFIGSNDDTTWNPPEDPGSFPRNWGAAAAAAVPSSYGTLTGNINAQAFLNVGSANANGFVGIVREPLELSIGIAFYDPQPVSGIETAGFRKGLPAYSSEDGFTLSDVTYGGYPAELAGLGEGTLTGVARLINKNGSVRLSEGAFSAIRSYQAGSPYDPGAIPVDAAVIYALWQLADIRYAPGWHAVTGFEATDIAGNEYTPAGSLELWWMRQAEPFFTAMPREGEEEPDPVFAWALNRFSDESPENAEPCYPIARFRIFAAETLEKARPEGLCTPPPDAELITGWSNWTADQTLNRATLITPGYMLGDALDANTGRWLLLEMQVADEAGNLSPNSDYSNVSSQPCIFSDPWYNPGFFGTTVETRVQARFWHNITSDNEFTAGSGLDHTTPAELRRRSFDETDFGAASRIPLAPWDPGKGITDAEYQRVEGEFTITMVIPEEVEPRMEYVYAEWLLYEDGRPAAAGTIWPQAPNRQVQLQVPEDILFLNQAGSGTVQPPGENYWLRVDDNLTDADLSAFLSEGPGAADGIRDRLGDDGDKTARRTSVNYLLSVRTVAMMRQTAGPPIPEADTTPSLVRFTVYAEGADDARDDQSIKMNVRE